MLNHTDLWNAIDRLAELNGLSPSGLAKKAGLSATLFNPSKRQSKKRKRWPSTESIAAILEATQTSLDDFIALANPSGVQQFKIPLLNMKEAADPTSYNAEKQALAGLPWDEMPVPACTDEGAFGLEIPNKNYAPFYRESDILILSGKAEPRRNDRVVLCSVKGEIFIRQLGRLGAHKIELFPLMGDAPPLTLERQAIRWMKRIIWVSQ